MAWPWRRAQQRQASPVVVHPAHRVEPPDHAALLEHAEEAMLVVAQGAVKWLNPAARLIFSPPADPVGRPLVEVVRHHRIESLAALAEETQREQSAELELPVSGRRLQVRALPLPAGRVSLLMLDISRRRYLETVRQQFVANLSHEMRTPLAGLDLAVQTLLTQLPADGDARLFVDRINQESRRLQAILANLSQLAALDAEGIEVARGPFSVAELLDGIVANYRARASAAGVDLRVEAGDQRLQIMGDRGKTDQALRNIVDNALKFTHAGEIVVSVRADDTRVEIAVRDTGLGIPPRDLPRIFERFYKVDRARGGQPGSGLGLSIARHLVELQGGVITADSTPGAGTTVRVRLPRASLTSS
jgi:two-component system phosphate regulon sensor histidine kinase PhoR